MQDYHHVGIVGCGNMGFALAQRLTMYGFNVVLGSRFSGKYPGKELEIVPIIDCIRRSPLIFVALHSDHYKDSLVSYLDEEPSLFDGKILVDLSNPSLNKSILNTISNAEQLQMDIPMALVVKAFNTISAFVMQSSTAGEPRTVFVASDHSLARDKVMTLAREINFGPVNAGSLRVARSLERDSTSLFPQWRMPAIVTLTIVLIWLIYTLCMEYAATNETSWNQLFLNITNKALCPSVITMLAIVYMPSNLACIFQLAYSTRDRRFPAWLDRWLLERKQLGLFTFAIAICHSIISIILMKPAYYYTWFHPMKLIFSTTQNATDIIVPNGLMTTKGELASLLGILTQLSMSIQAITSISSIGNQLNWREWRFVQSKLGTVTLLLAVGHVAAMATPRWIQLGFARSLYNLALLCLYFPLLTLLLKFLFWSPCLSRRLHRIRRGETTKVAHWTNQSSSA